ncbi:MAG: 30S ribosomal protein S20 [Gammaproteobacteria bacterium]|nr:30S ribosomal protein S20 [Gammaproteobacteria bacterium]
MANSPQAKKRAKQSEVRRQRNVAMRSKVRTSVKSILKAIEGGDKEAATSAFKAAVPIIDSMATKGILHKNKAARQKSRLNAQIKAMA